MSRRNIVFVFADQMRAQTTGFNGAKVQTPYMDKMAAEGVVFDRTISNVPVCTPWRAAFLSGQYPLSTGMFMNDVTMPTDRPTFGTVLRDDGYDTAYIGKWHLDGPDRSGYTPPGPRRQGFDFWAVGNCTHNYDESIYYHDSDEPKFWDGYDAVDQTTLAVDYIEKRKKGEPFALVLSWGPPHNPYRMLPDRYLDMYAPGDIDVRPNCSEPNYDDLTGYYAHVTALDDQLARVGAALEEQGLMENTIFVFTSDHGDMLGSQGVQRKQHPWDESVVVPYVMRCPGQASKGHRVSTPFNVVDIMPTLLGLAGVPIPDTCEGLDHTPAVRGDSFEGNDGSYIMSIAPFAEYRGQPWRGVRTERYTYVRNLNGPWLLYDNRVDPYQLNNLIDQANYADLQTKMDAMLERHMRERGDELLPAQVFLDRFGYEIDEVGAVPYRM